MVILNLLTGELESMQVVSHTNVAHMQMLGDLLVTVAADGEVAHYSFRMREKLVLVQERRQRTGYKVQAALVTAQLLFIACSDDNTVRVHQADTMKFRMALYGHALPVT